jgi:hypothetical protein
MAAAVPLQQLNKRDIVWETRTSWDVTTIHVTTTVWLEPGEAAPTHFGHHHKKPKGTSTIRHTVTVQPAAPSSPPEQSSPNVAPSPSSPAAAPTSTWSPPPPADTSTPAAAPSPKPKPKPKPTSGGGGGNYPSNGLSGAAAAGTEYTGDFTWYQTGLGACGVTSSPSDHIVAISEDLFDQYATANPNDNPVCGKTVTLTGVDGSAYPATIVDRCTGCALSDLDLSEDFFNLVTNNGNGRVSGMHWVFD